MAKMIDVRNVTKLIMARTNMNIGKLRSRLEQLWSQSRQMKCGTNVSTTNTDFGNSIYKHLNNQDSLSQELVHAALLLIFFITSLNYSIKCLLHTLAVSSLVKIY